MIVNPSFGDKVFIAFAGKVEEAEVQRKFDGEFVNVRITGWPIPNVYSIKKLSDLYLNKKDAEDALRKKASAKP